MEEFIQYAELAERSFKISVNEYGLKMLKDAIMKNQHQPIPHLFNVRAGEIFGIFGSAGSGTTEMLRFMEQSIIGLEQGPATSLAHTDTNAHFQMGQQPVLQARTFEDLRGSTLEAFLGAIFPLDISSRTMRQQLKRSLTLLERYGDPFSIPIFAADPATISMFIILVARIKPPAHLIIDDPTRGASLEMRGEIHRLLREIRALNLTTVILATQDPLEAALLCDRLAIVDQGRVVAYGTIDGLARTVDAAAATPGFLDELQHNLRIQNALVG